MHLCKIDQNNLLCFTFYLYTKNKKQVKKQKHNFSSKRFIFILSLRGYAKPRSKAKLLVSLNALAMRSV